MTITAAGFNVEAGHFREVLGHYPTGVAIVTAIGADGDPIGMVVGSFTSVSLDPPLVAFLPDKSSTTFPKVRDATSFCINVLGASQQTLCRTFATRGVDRFGGNDWRAAPSGAPILDGVVAWIDCEPETIHEAGDHWIVIGQVKALQVESPTLPLLFFQGGYGAFALDSVVMGARFGLHDKIVLADQALPVMEDLAHATGSAVLAFAPFDGELFVVASATPTPDSIPSRVGCSLPFMPPAGRLFVAWADEEVVSEWFDRAAEKMSAMEVEELRRDLESARRYGWIPTVRSDGLEDLWETIYSIQGLGKTPRLAHRLENAVAQLERHSDPALVGEHNAPEVHSLSAPVFSAAGEVVLMITVMNIPVAMTLDEIVQVKDRLLETAVSVTRSIGGRAPVR